MQTPSTEHVFLSLLLSKPCTTPTSSYQQAMKITQIASHGFAWIMHVLPFFLYLFFSSSTLLICEPGLRFTKSEAQLGSALPKKSHHRQCSSSNALLLLCTSMCDKCNYMRMWIRRPDTEGCDWPLTAAPLLHFPHYKVSQCCHIFISGVIALQHWVGKGSLSLIRSTTNIIPALSSPSLYSMWISLPPLSHFDILSV